MCVCAHAAHLFLLDISQTKVKAWSRSAYSNACLICCQEFFFPYVCCSLNFFVLSFPLKQQMMYDMKNDLDFDLCLVPCISPFYDFWIWLGVKYQESISLSTACVSAYWLPPFERSVICHELLHRLLFVIRCLAFRPSVTVTVDWAFGRFPSMLRCCWWWLFPCLLWGKISDESVPAFAFFFLKWISACAHQFHLLSQDQSTVAQRAEMTQSSVPWESCVWAGFPDRFPYYAWTAQSAHPDFDGSRLGVTCYLHFWENDRGLLRASAATRE